MDFSSIPVTATVWAVTCVFLVMAEIFTAGFFFLFFAIGAVAAAIAAFFIPNLIIQSLIFVVVSMIALVFARPFLKTAFNITDDLVEKSNVDALIGADVLVLETVKKHEGRVKVVHTGEVWSAYLADEANGTDIAEGVEAVITLVDGAKLAVKSK